MKMVRTGCCGGTEHVDLKSLVKIPGGYWPVSILKRVPFTPDMLPKTSLTTITSELYIAACN